MTSQAHFFFIFLMNKCELEKKLLYRIFDPFPIEEHTFTN